MTILIGGLAAVMFGIGDLVAGVGGRRDGAPGAPVGIALMASVIGVVLSGLYLLLLSNDRLVANP